MREPQRGQTPEELLRPALRGQRLMKAVHFGAGNIGRGFVGLLLHEGGYEVVFSDVAAALDRRDHARPTATPCTRWATAAATASSTGFRAINSATHPDEVVDEIATADVVTTAVGPTILRFVAPHIVTGLRAAADPMPPPLQIMACENAINATDLLRDEIDVALGRRGRGTRSPRRAVFANTAVDRIVPGQAADGGGVDVTVEPFFEWAIERPPFGDDPPDIPGAHFVDDLAPYIERKLFTVNTGHAATAYFGFVAGVETITDALADPDVAAAGGARRSRRPRRSRGEARTSTEEQQAEYRADDPRAVPQPRAARHRLARRTPAAAQARAGTSASSARRPSSRERGLPVDGAGRRHGRGARASTSRPTPRASSSRSCWAPATPRAFVHEVTGIGQGHPLESGLVDAVAGVQAAR